ncbi:hypothetical protein [Micromonospora sp. DT233]|uniref:hypothetical protein n=1 Tax=Micromonospora sp. DT233 TaxID=3393432 RepID=UPI003CE91B5C
MTEATHALLFGVAAAAYDRFRPRCPQEAVRWALDGLDAPARVVELGLDARAARPPPLTGSRQTLRS